MRVNAGNVEAEWTKLYKIGGVAALAAGLLFRRNLSVEISLFSAQKQPDTVLDWFVLLQSNRLLGLAYLDVFDLLNYALLGLVFLALYAALRRTDKSRMAIALLFGLVGIVVYFAANASLSMLALSDQYAAAVEEAQRIELLAAGQASLAAHRFAISGAHPGTGGYLSLLLVAVAGVIVSLVMLRSEVFNRAVGIVGVIANGLDLVYCALYIFAPALNSELLPVLFLPAAGLCFMVWHVMIGWRLFKLGKETKSASG